MDYQPGNPQNGPGNGYNPYNNPYGNNPYNNNPNNPYGTPFTPVPVRHKGDGMATASMALGIISLVSLLLLRVTLPFLLGGISIILAVLSRGGAKKFLSRAKTGLTCTIIALGLDIAFCTFALWLAFILPNHSPQFREELNRVCEQQYGFSYDELIDEMGNVWDGDPLNEDIWDKLGY